MFSKVEQDCSGSAGNVYHAILTILFCQLQIEVLKAFVLVKLLIVHHIKISVIIFRHIFVIMQIHIFLL